MKQEAIGVAGNHYFLQQQLDHIGERLQQPLEADPVRADPVLHVPDDFALRIGQVGDTEDQRHQHHHDLQAGNDEIAQRLRAAPSTAAAGA